MGVKDLWNILSPLCERKPMFELQGKTIAIDISCWIVDSQTVSDNSAQPKMYLRNLFFRTAFLLMQNISPVFVLEGKAPTLKHNTIAKRNDVRSGFRVRKTARKGGRLQFNKILNECAKMLQYMGLVCVQGHGEAEAMCAYLNEDGLVDGCISQDSDCFLYGAKVVYRNFCTSAQGNRGGTGGAVDEYNLEKIEKILGLGRNKMIALALLCGCDYDDGINGVGKEAAMKLFKIVEDEDILERIKNWKTDDTLCIREAKLTNPNFCSSCGHNGKVQKHAKSGCMDCGTDVKCNDSYREQRALLLNEIALQKKALLIENFPNQELIDEFLIRKDPVPKKIDIQWKQPQINEFIDFMEQHLSWKPQYAFEKIFPLMTRWQLLHLPTISIENHLMIPDLFVPETIKKIRNIRSVASYEIIWKTDHEIIEKLKEYIALDEENDDNDTDILAELTSIEPQDVVQKCYPKLVELFENTRNVKVKKRSAKNRIQDGKNSNDNVAKRKPEKRRQKKKEPVENIKKIEEFLLKDHSPSLEESFEKMSITPKRSKMFNDQQENPRRNDKMKRGPQFDKVLQVENTKSRLNNTLDRMFNELSPDDFISDNDDHDLNISQIIDNICRKRAFHFNIKENVRSPKAENTLCGEGIDNFKVINNLAYAQAELNQDQTSNIICNEPGDEFGYINESYVPLNERILSCKGKDEFPKAVAQTNDRFSFGVETLMDDSNPEARFHT
ncbi:Flap endonuclease GEN [Anthophora plagiata]